MFSRDFLSRMAQQYQLTPEQQDVLLLRFSSERKSYQEIAEILETSVDGIYKRASLIYEKFGIEGDSRGKEHRLRSKLREIQSPTPKESPDDQDSTPDTNLQQDSNTLHNHAQNFTNLQTDLYESPVNAVARLQEITIALQQKGESYVDHALQEIIFLLPIAIAQVANASDRTRLEITTDVVTAIATELENSAAKSIYERGLDKVTDGVQSSLKDLEKALRLGLS